MRTGKQSFVQMCRQAGIAAVCIVFGILLCGHEKQSVYAMETEEKKGACTLTLEVPKDSVLFEEKEIPDIVVSFYKLSEEQKDADAGQLKKEIDTGAPEETLVVKNGTGTAEDLAPGSYLVLMQDAKTDAYVYQFTPYIVTLMNGGEEMVCEIKAGRNPAGGEKTQTVTTSSILPQTARPVWNGKPVKTDDNLWQLLKGTLGIFGSGLILIAFVRKKREGERTERN